MKIDIESIVQPLPSEVLLSKEEKMWKVVLPESYKDFIKDYNGAIPIDNQIKTNLNTYIIERFLCILGKDLNNPNGNYDIDVILTQIEERLTDNENLVGVELLPIAALFSGDFLCLDYRKNCNVPSVCIWSHEESGELDPVTYFVTDGFDDFLKLFE